jgi:hypothetical protein
MALDIYAVNGKNKGWLGSLDYDAAPIQGALDYVEQKTGLHIDVYGRTLLHEKHRLALLEGLQSQKTAVSAATLAALTDFDSTKKLVLFGD